MVRAYVTQKEKSRPQRAVLADHGNQGNYARKQTVLSSAEQAGSGWSGALYYEREPLAGRQPAAFWLKALPRTGYE